MPPREGAPPPRPLPSTPPQTDDIDTDWGVEQPAAAQTQESSASVSAQALPDSSASNVPVEPVTAPAPEQGARAAKRSATPPPAAPPLVPGVRRSRPHAQTLLGMPEPKLRSTPPTSTVPAATASDAPSMPAMEPPDAPVPAPAAPDAPSALAATPVTQDEPLAPTPAPSLNAQADANEARSSVPSATEAEPPSPVASSTPIASSTPVASSTPIAASTPIASSATPALQPARERSAAPPTDAAAPKRSGRAIAWLAVAGLGLGVIGYVATHRAQPPGVSADVQAAIPAAPPTQPLPAAAPAPESAPTPSANAATPSANAAPNAEPPSANAASPSASGNTAEAGTITVTVKSVPPKARIFHFGKQVGVTPWVVELKPGERHAYEIGSPGRTTRKLVLDGSKTEITVGLKPAP